MEREIKLKWNITRWTKLTQVSPSSSNKGKLMTLYSLERRYITELQEEARPFRYKRRHIFWERKDPLCEEDCNKWHWIMGKGEGRRVGRKENVPGVWSVSSIVTEIGDIFIAVMEFEVKIAIFKRFYVLLFNFWPLSSPRFFKYLCVILPTCFCSFY